MTARESSIASGSSSDIYGQMSDSEKRSNGARQLSEGHKRKAEYPASPFSKKPKLSSNQLESSETHIPFCANLPPHVWQNVFSYLRPQELGRLLQVNRAFHFYLTKIRHVSENSSKGYLNLQTSEAVWSSSRKMYEPQFPKPLIGLLELDMWKLVKGRRCQFCGKSGRRQGSNIWDRGPGKDGDRPVWAFGIRTCGPCLDLRTEKDTALLMSPASALLPGLPFVFITQDLHVVPASIVHQASTIPHGIQLRKCYYTTHIDKIQEQLAEARALGPAAAEEWFKGLESQGKARLADAERCERWEASHGQASTPGSIPSSTAPAYPRPVANQPAAAPALIPVPMDPRTWQNYGPQAAAMYSPVPLGPYQPPMPLYASPAHHGYNLPPQLQPPFIPQSQTPTYPHAYAPPPIAPQRRPDRTLKDITEAKAARRAEIERRCEALETPIPPNVLRHMEAYNAALQLTNSLTDDEWERLLPKLVSQREAAVQRDRQEATQKPSMQHRPSERRGHEMSQRELKDLQDKEWDEAQKPIRTKLGSYADEIINSQWDRGRLVTRDNSPQFAAAVLLHVKDRFWQEVKKPEFNTEADSSDTNHAEGRLILENMKWVFDHKIKHLTDRHRKELFLCSGCEGNFKYYGFEGVIQHYGAKHTNTFSVGNVVVSWKEAEWPEEPPFIPDPSLAKAGSANAGYGTYQGALASRGHSITPQMFSNMPRPLSQASLMSGYQPGPYMAGPFQPPPMQPGAPGCDFDPQQVQLRPASNISHGYFYPGSPPAPPTGPHLGAPNPFAMDVMNGSGTSQSQPGDADPSQGHTNLALTGGHPSNSQSSPRHASHLASMTAESVVPGEQVSTFARAFIDVWSTLSGIKELSNSVRLHVTINAASSSFEKIFGKKPEFEVFVRAMETDPLLEPHKTVGALDCSLCPPGPSPFPPGIPVFGDDFGFTVMSLLSHFKQKHTPENRDRAVKGETSEPTWATKLISLPRPYFITALADSEGMDDRKLSVIATVFPSQFPKHAPKQTEVGVSPETSNIPSSKGTKATDAKGATDRPEKAAGSPSGHVFEAYSPRPVSPQLGPNEYDPRRPDMDTNARSYMKAQPRRRQYRVSTSETDYRGPVYYVPTYEEEVRDRHQHGYYVSAERDPWYTVRTGSPSSRPYQNRLHTHLGNERSRSPRIVEPVPDRRLPSGQSYIRPNVLDIDEVAAAEVTKENSAANSATPPAGTEGEAERFLNNLTKENDLEIDVENYKRQAEERDRQREDAVGADWQSERRDHEGDVEHYPRVERHSRERPIRYSGPPIIQDRRREDYPVNGRSPEPRAEFQQRSGSYRRRGERFVEPIPASRLARYMRVYRGGEPDANYHGQRTARPQSRYDRYEATRRQIERSQSPSRRVSERPETYRGRSTDHGRSTQASPHEPMPMYEDNYSPAPPFVRYRHAEPPPPMYMDEYGRPVEFVRVREPQYTHHSPRYDAPPDDPPFYDYRPLDRQPREERVYYEPAPGYAYHPERRPLPPLPPQEREMTYEAEIPRVKPEPTVTPAPFVEQP